MLQIAQILHDLACIVHISSCFMLPISRIRILGANKVLSFAEDIPALVLEIAQSRYTLRSEVGAMYIPEASLQGS